jgi:hypothetical protein
MSFASVYPIGPLAAILIASTAAAADDFKPGDNAIVKGVSAEIKAEARRDSQTLEKISRRTTVTVEKVSGDWLAINEPLAGWIEARDVASPRPALDKVLGVVSFARMMVFIYQEKSEKAISEVTNCVEAFPDAPVFLALRGWLWYYGRAKK